MAIPLTNLQKARVVEQIQRNLVQLQGDMVRNANTHKAMVTAQSPDVTTLAGFVQDCAASYLTRLQWVIDLRNNPTRKARLLEMLALMGWTEADIVDVVTALRSAAIALRDAPKTSYAEITAACDAVLAAVDAPDSLWPE